MAAPYKIFFSLIKKQFNTKKTFEVQFRSAFSKFDKELSIFEVSLLKFHF
jgi:hypothetical protein